MDKVELRFEKLPMSNLTSSESGASAKAFESAVLSVPVGTEKNTTKGFELFLAAIFSKTTRTKESIASSCSILFDFRYAFNSSRLGNRLFGENLANRLKSISGEN